MKSIRFIVGAALALGATAAVAQDATPARTVLPRISLILGGSYAEYSSEAPADVPGVLLGPETEPRPGGFSLGESELVLESNVDPHWHAWASVAFEDEDGETVVAVEEAYINSLALPAGFALKAGRFLSDLGYQNRIHGHAWDFADLPLPYRALLAGQVNDDGVQLRWVAPTDLFVELGAELLRGGQFPAGGAQRDGVNSYVGFVHLGGDAGIGGSWRVGLSHLQADADARDSGEEGGTQYQFTGDSGVSIVDVVFKWAQDGNPAKRNFVLNAEYFRRSEDGTVAFDDGATTGTSDYDGTQAGFYVQGVFQPIPRWRAGLRYDRLAADNTLATPDPAFGTLADEDAAQRYTAMVDFSNSEFSRLRVQYTRDESRPGGEADDQWVLQYFVSIGSHTAHQF